jgi:hypothetical protein
MAVAMAAVGMQQPEDEEMKRLEREAAKEKQSEMEGLPQRVSRLENELVTKRKFDDPATFRFYWKDGFAFETADKAFAGTLGGRFQFDGAFMHHDEDTVEGFRSVMAAPGSTSSKFHEYEDGFTFRRVYLSLSGTLY